MTIILNQKEKGNLGEVFVEKYCKAHNMTFQKATKTEDIHFGIDCFIHDQPTDIKNTKDIFILQILSDGKISVRHPFRESTKATHYCFVNVSSEQKEWVEFTRIDIKLERDFIKSYKDLWEMKKWLYTINNKHWKDFHQTLSGTCLFIKKKLLTFCKEESYLKYGSVEHSKDNQIYFKLMTKHKSKESEKLNLDTIKNARERIAELKEKMKTVTKTVDSQTKDSEEEIVTIVI